jgi:hypothetical protein
LYRDQPHRNYHAFARGYTGSRQIALERIRGGGVFVRMRKLCGVKRTVWWMILICAWGLSACTAPIPGTPHPAPPTKWQPRPDRPKDRDPALVDSAMKRLDLCSLIDPAILPPGLPPTFKRDTELDNARCKMERNHDWLLTVEDNQDTRAGARLTRAESAVDEILGVKAYRLEFRENGQPERCDYFAPVSFTRSVKVTAYREKVGDRQGCSLARAFFEAAMRRLLANPAVKPLLYGPDEQDTGSIGACADWIVLSAGDACDPAQDVAVPAGGERILETADYDPNVSCAVFKSAVTEVFGPEFEAVVISRACYFVRPGLGLQFETGVTALGDPPGWWGPGSVIGNDQQKTAFAGKAAVTYRREGFGGYFGIHASPHNDLNRRGHVRLEMKSVPSRGISDFAKPGPSDADIEKAKQVITQVLARYFP